MPFGLHYKQSVKIGEHTINLPECPKDESKILFFDKPYEEAYWKRENNWPDVFLRFEPNATIVDQEDTKVNEETGMLIRASVKDTTTIRETYYEIMNRRINGVFFRNGNDIEYLTGANWFMLEFCKMFGNSKNDGYGLFYKFQRDVFYLLDYVESEPWILGLDLSKAKKTGVTQIVDGGFVVERATRCPEYLVGFMSRNEQVAVDNNFKLFYYAFQNLPKALQPVGTVAERAGRIDFSHASRGRFSKNSNIEYLNTRVFCGPTAEHTFDSHFMRLIHLDEVGKYWQDSKKSPKAVFNGNKAAVKDQDQFRGIIILTCYPPEVDDVGSREAAEIYDSSKLATKKFGYTESELICYHIPAYKSLKSFINKFGDCDEQAAMERIMQNRERVKKDRRAALAELRQNPNDEEEAFGSGKQGATFDPIRLGELKTNLKEEQRAAPGNNYRSGKLEWENWKWEVGLKNKRPRGEFCPVKFVPLTEAELEAGIEPKIRIYYDIAPNLLNAGLKRGKDEHGCLVPPSRFKYVLGGDPTSYALDGELTESSKNAGVVMSIPDEKVNRHYGNLATGLIHIEYYDRPELPDEAYEDFVKLIIYTDSLVFMEANAPHVGTMLMQEGLGRFMIVKENATGNLVLWQRWMGLPQEAEKLYKQFRITNNGTTERADLDTMIRLWKTYFGISDTEIEKDYGKTIKSERILEQASKFDPTNTKKSDLIMAGGYAHWAIDVYFDVLLRVAARQQPEITFEGMMGAFTR